MGDDEGTNWSEQVDRKRGILTQDDREYLLGKKTIEGQDEINHRYRIRQRIIQSLLDLVLVVRHLRSDDLKQIANDDRIANLAVQSAPARLAYDLLYWSEKVTNPTDVFEQVIGKTVLAREPPETTDGGIIEHIAHVDIEIEHRESTASAAVMNLFASVNNGEIPQEQIDDMVSLARRITEDTEGTADEAAIRRLINHMMDEK